MEVVDSRLCIEEVCKVSELLNPEELRTCRQTYKVTAISIFMLNTKYILKPRKKEEGLIISVMSRHTLKDGKTPDRRIIKFVNYDLWLPIFAPPLKLVGDYYGGLPWEEFEQRYLNYLSQPDVKVEVQKLAEESLRRITTLSCIEKDPEKCHRRLLAERCKEYQPGLVLSIR